MNTMDLSYRIKQLSDTIEVLKSEVKELKDHRNEENMWDTSDMIRNWKISQRTLATWRAEGLIEYVQLGSKIWYPKACRDAFIERNMVRNRTKNHSLAICEN
jgi:hypothetical protein